MIHDDAPDFYSQMTEMIINPMRTTNCTHQVSTRPQRKKEFNLNPDQLIFQPELKTTIVKWNDGDTTVVHCTEGEEFVPEVGYAMALVKKLFPSRSAFLRMVDEGHIQKPVSKKIK